MRPISLKNKILENIFSAIGIIFSSFIFAISINTFISPTGMLSGGVGGVSLIIGRLLTKINVNIPESSYASIFYFIINIPILFLSIKKLNKRFTILSIIHISCTTLFMNIFPDGIRLILKDIDFITHKLDAALFAGSLCGFSTALSFLSHGSGGGIDIISAYFASFKQKSIGSISMTINMGILVLGGILFSNWSAMLYSIVYLIVNVMVLDMIYVRNKRTILNIITTNGDAVSEFIMKTFRRGVTKMEGIGAYTKANKEFLYVVTTSYEAKEICDKVKEFDPGCFISITPTSQIVGRFGQTLQKY